MTTEAIESSVERPATNSASGAAVWLIAWRNLWRNRRRTWLTSGGHCVCRVAAGVCHVHAGRHLRDHDRQRRAPRPRPCTDPASRVPGRSPNRVHGHWQSGAPRTGRGDGRGRHCQRAPAGRLRWHQTANAALVRRSWVWMRPVRPSGLLCPGWSARDATSRGLGKRLSVRFWPAIWARKSGDEIVLLGTAREGGVAAAVAEVVGLFTSGQAALDRARGCRFPSTTFVKPGTWALMRPTA